MLGTLQRPARWALVLGVVWSLGCSKKESEPARTRSACVLMDESGAVFQCFERFDTRSREQAQELCNAYEAAKRTLQDGECPKPGRVGVCSIGDGDRRGCYRDVDECESSCKSSNGVFARE
jgi:hypothetical protein